MISYLRPRRGPLSSTAAASRPGSRLPTTTRGWLLYSSRLLGAGALVLLLLYGGGFLFLCIHRYLHPLHGEPDTNPSSFGLPYEDVPLHTSDGLRLASWFIPGDDASGAALVMVHGISSNRTDLLPVAEDLHRHGYSLLMLDLRAHGQSEGDTSTLGVKEVEDIRAAVGALATEPGVSPNRIGIYGLSLGSAVALQAAGAIPEIKAVIADSPFASVSWALQNESEAFIPLPGWMSGAVMAVGGWDAGVDPRLISPIDGARHLDGRPLLLIHGGDDEFLIPANSLMIRDAATGPTDLWIVPGASHAGAYSADPDAYMNKIASFLAATLATTT